jgi:hypothetical protein
MDDFFRKPKDGQVSAHHEPGQELKQSLHPSGKRLDLWVVLYEHQLDQPLAEYLALCDYVQLWTWYGQNLTLRTNFDKARKLSAARRWHWASIGGISKPETAPYGSHEEQCETALQSLSRATSRPGFLRKLAVRSRFGNRRLTRKWIRMSAGSASSAPEIVSYCIRTVMPVRMKDVARDLKVSVVTVSKRCAIAAISATPRRSAFSSGSASRIISPIGSRAESGERAHAYHRPGSSGFDVFFFAEVAKGYDRKVAALALSLTIPISEQSPRLESEEVHFLLARRVDGLVIASAQSFRDTTLFARSTNTKFLMS